MLGSPRLLHLCAQWAVCKWRGSRCCCCTRLQGPGGLGAGSLSPPSQAPALCVGARGCPGPCQSVIDGARLSTLPVLCPLPHRWPGAALQNQRCLVLRTKPGRAEPGVATARSTGALGLHTPNTPLTQASREPSSPASFLSECPSTRPLLSARPPWPGHRFSGTRVPPSVHTALPVFCDGVRCPSSSELQGFAPSVLSPAPGSAPRTQEGPRVFLKGVMRACM